MNFKEFIRRNVLSDTHVAHLNFFGPTQPDKLATAWNRQITCVLEGVSILDFFTFFSNKILLEGHVLELSTKLGVIFKLVSHKVFSNNFLCPDSSLPLKNFSLASNIVLRR